MPVDVYLQEAENLYHWCQDDEAQLTGAGLAWNLVQEIPVRAGALREALDPLRDRPGDCFAIFGNHDHEAPDEVMGALAELDIRLLVDEEAIAHTPVGPVQLIGADYVGRKHSDHLEKLLARYPRIEGHLRLLLLHDPLGFRTIAPG